MYRRVFRPTRPSPCRAIPHSNLLASILRAVVAQSPRSHLLRLALGYAHDDVAVPRPSVLAVILAGSRRMIRMRMIPANHIQPLLARGLLRIPYILRVPRKAISRRIFAAVHSL